jgi:hypothetical protein
MSLADLTIKTPDGLEIVRYGDDDPVHLYMHREEIGHIVPYEKGPEYTFIPNPEHPGLGVPDLNAVIAAIQSFERYRAKLLADRRDDAAGVRRLP